MKKQSQEYQEERVYFSLIEKVGSWGKYQCGLFCIFALISLMQGALGFVSPYLFNQTSYQCPEMSEDACNLYVCSSPQIGRMTYLPPSQFISLADDLEQDFRCQSPSLLPMLTSLVYIAGLIGLVIFSAFSQKIGRNELLIAASCMELLGLGCTLLSGYFKSIWMEIIAIMFTYAGTEMAYQSIYCFSTEVVREKSRIFYVNALNSIYGVGIMVDAITFYFVKDWTIIYACVFGIPALLILIGAFFFVEKTPINLLEVQSGQRILQSLNRIAKLNNLQPTVTIQQITYLKQRYLITLKSNQKQGAFWFVDLFRYQSLRKLIFPLLPLNFIIYYMYFAPSVATIGQDTLSKGLIQGSSAALASFLTFFLLNNLNRRTVAFCLISLIFMFHLWLLFEEDDKAQVYYIAYFVYRLLLSIFFNVIYLVNYETFPTQIRGSGSSFCAAFAMVAVIIQPYVNSVTLAMNLRPMHIFAVLTAIALIPNYFMKQTYDIPPPEIIEQLNQEASR